MNVILRDNQRHRFSGPPNSILISIYNLIPRTGAPGGRDKTETKKIEKHDFSFRVAKLIFDIGRAEAELEKLEKYNMDVISGIPQNDILPLPPDDASTLKIKSYAC